MMGLGGLYGRLKARAGRGFRSGPVTPGRAHGARLTPTSERATPRTSSGFASALRTSLTPIFFGLKTRAEVWTLVSDLLAARLDVGQALTQAARIHELRGRKFTALVLMDLRETLSTGRFVEAMARIAPGAEALIFARFGRADAGRLFEGAARIARAELAMRRALTQALATPALLVALVGGLYYLLGSMLFPTLETISDPAGWPASARITATLAYGFVAWFWQIMLGLGALVLLLRWSLTRPFEGRLLLDRIPPWSLYKLRVASAFLFAIVETARTGGEIKTSTLRAMAASANPYVRDRLLRIADELVVGNLGEAAIRAGQEFPARDLNAILAIVAAQDGWVERFATFLDRWIADIEVTIARATGLLKITLLFVITGSFGSAMSNILVILQNVR